jgi:hypothetical protein
MPGDADVASRRKLPAYRSVSGDMSLISPGPSYRSDEPETERAANPRPNVSESTPGHDSSRYWWSGSAPTYAPCIIACMFLIITASTIFNSSLGLNWTFRCRLRPAGCGRLPVNSGRPRTHLVDGAGRMVLPAEPEPCSDRSWGMTTRNTEPPPGPLRAWISPPSAWVMRWASVSQRPEPGSSGNGRPSRTVRTRARAALP